MKAWFVVLALCSVCVSASRTHGQHLFLDVDGDRKSTSADQLAAGGLRAVDVWLATDEDLDGSASTIRTESGRAPGVYSYELLLRAIGGSVAWREYMNRMEAMPTQLGSLSSESEMYVAYGGPVLLPAGKYLLGTVKVEVLSGTPRIEIVDASPAWPLAQTAFGSDAPGTEVDNTLRFKAGGRQNSTLSRRHPGDWFEAIGLSEQAGEARGAAPITTGSGTAKFGARLVPVVGPLPMELRVTTTRRGRIRVAVFDVAGRLAIPVRVTPDADAGVHTYSLEGQSGARKLASGVYLYRIEADEGSLSGKFAVVR